MLGIDYTLWEVKVPHYQHFYTVCSQGQLRLKEITKENDLWFNQNLCYCWKQSSWPCRGLLVHLSSSMFQLLYFISKYLLKDCAVVLYTNFCAFMLIPSNQYNAYTCFPHFTAFNTLIVLQQYSQLSEVNEPWNFFPCIKPLAALFHCHGFCFYPACVYVGGNVH